MGDRSLMALAMGSAAASLFAACSSHSSSSGITNLSDLPRATGPGM